MAKRARTRSEYLLRGAVTDSKRKTTVQLPEQFARTTDQTPAGYTPVLAQLLRASEVPLRLYLTLVMMTTKPETIGEPHPLHRLTAPSHFAEMLGYDDLGQDRLPGAGTRRVDRALRTLEKMNLLKITRTAGRIPAIAVRHPDGDLRPPYITIPIEFWKNTWITALSGRALATYIALRLVTVGKRQGQGQHLAPYDRDRFGLSDDTWQRGTRELVDRGLLEIRSGVVENRGLRARHRNVYYLNFDRVIDERPEDPVKPIASALADDAEDIDWSTF